MARPQPPKRQFMEIEERFWVLKVRVTFFQSEFAVTAGVLVVPMAWMLRRAPLAVPIFLRFFVLIQAERVYEVCGLTGTSVNQLVSEPESELILRQYFPVWPGESRAWAALPL